VRSLTIPTWTKPQIPRHETDAVITPNLACDSSRLRSGEHRRLVIYIPLAEKPGLVKRFGEDYEQYRRNVPRWIPRLTAWNG
jgi:hypothetical protein